ncbi:pancreatic progenitor cell differentiation and proliferation factor-like [Molossus nigricans]
MKAEVKSSQIQEEFKTQVEKLVEIPALLGRGAAARHLCKWAPRPSVLVPVTQDRAPRPARRPRQGFHQSTSKSMATILSSDYYRCHLGSTSSNSPCGSAEYRGEAIPHHRGLSKGDPGPWWAGFFLEKSTLPFMATVLESPEHSESPQASSSAITWDLAPEATRRQPGSQPGKASAGPPS